MGGGERSQLGGLCLGQRRKAYRRVSPSCYIPGCFAAHCGAAMDRRRSLLIVLRSGRVRRAACAIRSGTASVDHSVILSAKLSTRRCGPERSYNAAAPCASRCRGCEACGVRSCGPQSIENVPPDIPRRNRVAQCAREFAACERRECFTTALRDGRKSIVRSADPCLRRMPFFLGVITAGQRLIAGMRSGAEAVRNLILSRALCGYVVFEAAIYIRISDLLIT